MGRAGTRHVLGIHVGSAARPIVLKPLSGLAHCTPLEVLFIPMSMCWRPLGFSSAPPA